MPKGIKKFVNGSRAKIWEGLSQKVLRNSSMGIGWKMWMSFPKGVKKFVIGYRAKSLTVFTKKYKNGRKVL